MKKITILGSTGSIGAQALEIIRENRDLFSVTGLSCGRQIDLLSQQIDEFRPEVAVVSREEDRKIMALKHPKTEILVGAEGLIAAACGDCDMILNSLMGIMGLVPTYHGILNGKDIALANKETLVAGGQLVMDAVAENKVKLLPVDSEHCAIFQCLQGNKSKEVRKILLTASGGPFRGYSLAQLEKVTLAQALKHPKWTMGSKITIDSASMMNKGLEVIEAKWLFDLDLDKIQIVVHPQSILHSAVEYYDGSVIGQLGQPDMRVPISYAFGYPHRVQNQLTPLDLFKEGANLTFSRADPETFKTIKMAYQASSQGGTYPVVLNGANEVLVQLFLEDKIKFIQIQEYLEKVLDKHKPQYTLDLEGILLADRQAREDTMSLVSAGRS
ncbi:MAG: 1-deoxy-D-xylulose-5-phosphate reductoisomerase [Anaerovoracaceae bacterium]